MIISVLGQVVTVQFFITDQPHRTISDKDEWKFGTDHKDKAALTSEIRIRSYTLWHACQNHC